LGKGKDVMRIIRKGVRRVYTKKAWKFRQFFKGFLIVLFSPIIIPLNITIYLAWIAEEIDSKLDDFLEFIVDNLTPSFRKKG
jgi:hypothetical protein